MIVTLGSNCNITRILRDYLKLNVESYPFEWNYTFSTNGICDLLENNFDDLLNKELLITEKRYNDFRLINTKYNIHFMHEEYLFNKKNNTFDYEKFQKKYDYKINKYKQNINNNDKIIFIRMNPNILFNNNILYYNNLITNNSFDNDDISENILNNRLYKIFNNKEIKIYYIKNIDDINLLKTEICSTYKYNCN